MEFLGDFFIILFLNSPRLRCWLELLYTGGQDRDCALCRTIQSSNEFLLDVMFHVFFFGTFSLRYFVTFGFVSGCFVGIRGYEIQWNIDTEREGYFLGGEYFCGVGVL